MTTQTMPGNLPGNPAVQPGSMLFGLPFDAITASQAVVRCTEAIKQDTYLSVGVVNAAKVVIMRRDAFLRDAVASCHMILADGQSVVWASRMLGAPLPERVTGIDLFLGLLAAAAEHGYRVYFLGARPEVLNRVVAEATRQFPGLQVAGARDGYFRSEEEAEVAQEIRDSGADMLFLGMTSPKKELFLGSWGEYTGVHVAHGVGGSFDIMAGVTKRAPVWYQRHGLEWLYRAKQEPLRLGRRYLATNLSFMMLVARTVVRNGRAAKRLAQRTPEPSRSYPLASADLPGQGDLK